MSAIISKSSALNAGTRRYTASFLETITPTIYVPGDFDPTQVNFELLIPEKKRLFNLRTAFVPPEQMNYKLPEGSVPEFAFVGRSNVGKSTLVSKLIGNEKIVRVSKEPGCTRSVNFYAFNRTTTTHSPVFYLVDLPGYGFAKQSKTDRRAWSKMIDSYFSARNQASLRRVYVMIDCRRGVQDVDMHMMASIIKNAIPFQVSTALL